jgi:hypothetical protein
MQGAMHYSMWPFWLKVVFGVLNIALSGVVVFGWRKAEDGRRWILGAIAVYFLVFWVFMHT